MKTTLWMFLTLLGLLGNFVEAGKEPERLTSLREKWTAAKKEQADAITQKHLTALQSLQKELTKRNRLEEALLVRKEIESLKKESPRKDAQGAPPEKLRTLNARYNQDLARMEAAKDKLYYEALKKLQLAYAKQDKLDHALAVRAEVEKTQSQYIGPKPPKEAVSFRGHHYLLIEEKVTWDEAKKRCEELGGHLVTIKDKGEQEFVFRLLQSNKNQKDCWIGLSDHEKEGSWKWVTGEIVNFTNWASGEPNNGDDQEHWAGLSLKTKGAWNDANQKEYKLSFICEWDR